MIIVINRDHFEGNWLSHLFGFTSVLVNPLNLISKINHTFHCLIY